MARKNMDIKEFKEIGHLQEVNRLYFHPRGMALATGTISDNEKGRAEAPYHQLWLTNGEYKLLLSLLDRSVQALPTARGEEASGLIATLKSDDSHQVYEIGDHYLNSIWDSRDDPEGYVFGDLPSYPDSEEMAQNVRSEMLRHFEARRKLFGISETSGRLPTVYGPEIESLRWLHPESPDDDHSVADENGEPIGPDGQTA